MGKVPGRVHIGIIGYASRSISSDAGPMPVLDTGDAGLLVSAKHDSLRVSVLLQPPADYGLRVHM